MPPAHVKALGASLLSNEIDSWMTGINTNVVGKQTRIINCYSGSAPAYRARCDEVAIQGYVELVLASHHDKCLMHSPGACTEREYV